MYLGFPGKEYDTMLLKSQKLIYQISSTWCYRDNWKYNK